MKKFVLYCKSYRNDLLRVKRLAESIESFNEDAIPFYVSVPTSDRELFQNAFAMHSINFIDDEEIVQANPALIQVQIDRLSGWKSQQIIKSEFWRLAISEAYLCLDSDCVFIRSFGLSDFIAPDGIPYTVIHQAKELLQFALNNDMSKVCADFHKDKQDVMTIFNRVGPHYDFGPSPLIWHRAVWAALDREFLKPKNMSFYDAMLLFPAEIQWYGEAMLKYRPIPLHPIEPLFRVYHYERQFSVAKRQGETIVRLANDYLGVCYQSNWEKNTDFIAKPWLSRAARWIRRVIFRRYR